MATRSMPNLRCRRQHESMCARRGQKPHRRPVYTSLSEHQEPAARRLSSGSALLLELPTNLLPALPSRSCKPEHAQQMAQKVLALRSANIVWTACPSGGWTDALERLLRSRGGPYRFIDIGCNKGAHRSMATRFGSS